MLGKRFCSLEQNKYINCKEKNDQKPVFQILILKYKAHLAKNVMIKPYLSYFILF